MHDGTVGPTLLTRYHLGEPVPGCNIIGDTPMAENRRIASAANLLACAALAGLGAMAIAVAIMLGPFGVVVLGLLTLLICTKFTLDEHGPTWGAQVFSAQMTAAGSPEERAAAAEGRRTALAPIRFYRWSGVLLLVAGCAGVAWQLLV